MVAKKRCDFCLKIKPDNLHVEQKVLNKEIKNVLEKIAGIEVPAEQLSTILTCFECAIALIQAEPIAVKVRTLLTRLSKQKIKKKVSADDADSIVNASMLENDDKDDSQVADSSVKRAPQKITARRKSVSAKKLVDSIANDELEGSPAASSTMAINSSLLENKSTPKPTAKKQNKSNASSNDNGIMSSPDKTKKRKISEKSDSSVQNDEKASIKTPKKVNTSSNDNVIISSPNKAVKRQISDKSDSTIEKVEKAAIKTSKIADLASPAKLNKRTYSERSDYNSQEEAGECIKPFKKMKDPDERKSITDSADAVNGETVQECLECGKTFCHLERYEAHVLSQKCKLAAYACKHPDCLRRFYKLQKMLEHMQRKHPEMQDTEMD